MSHPLFDYLVENPGVADYMDLSSGTIYHTGGYGKCFGVIPTSNVYDNEEGCIALEESNTNSDYSKYEGILNTYSRNDNSLK